MNDKHIENINSYEDASSLINELVSLGKKVGENIKKNNLRCDMITPFGETIDKYSLPLVNKDYINQNINSEIRQMFTHYDVNPSVVENKEKIINTYVTNYRDNVPELKYIFKANENGVNPAFYNSLLFVIDKLKKGDRNFPEYQFVYITGIRGSGKTGFLNYFICQYEEELNKKKIISVRINVMRVQEDVNLNNAIEFKLCRILFTYYCSWDKKDDRLKNRKIKSDIDNILLEFSKTSKFKELDLLECHDYFCCYTNKEVTEIRDEYVNICKELLHEMAKSYKFIIMLDNFDQLSPNERGKNNYEVRYRELEKLKSEWIFSNSVFIIAVRYSTYLNLTFPGKLKSEIWSIGSPSTYDMIQKRIDYHFNKNNSIDEKKRDRVNLVKDIIRAIGSSFIIDSNDITFEEACEAIDSIYSGNKRIVMNIITRFIDSLRVSNLDEASSYGLISNSFLTKNSYKFFESLLIDTDKGYCKSFYDYELDVNNKLRISNSNGSAHHENNFAPNLYLFPCVEDEELMFTPFLKIRILQLLKNSRKPLNTSEICSILNNIFMYDEDAIRIACTELREDQSIILKNENAHEITDNYAELDKKRMRITERGKKMLEITPQNINILAVSLERIFLPYELIDSGMPIGNYFGESYQNPSDSTQFIINNIFCSLPKVVGLISKIEEYEQDMVEKKNATKHFKPTDFGIAEKLINAMQTGLGKIFKSFFMLPSGSNTSEATFINRRNDLYKIMKSCLKWE